MIFILLNFLAKMLMCVITTECPPKWKLAVDVLAEIKQDFRSKATSPSSTRPLTMSDTSGRVLFIVKDSLASAQLRDVLVAGVASVCDQRYRWFVSQQAAEIRSRVHKQHRQQTQKRWSGSKRVAEGAGGTANKQPRVAEAHPAVDNRSLFLYPRDSDLLGGPLDDAGTVRRWGESRDCNHAFLSIKLLAGSDEKADEPSLELGLPPQLFASLPMESKLILIQVCMLRYSPSR